MNRGAARATIETELESLPGLDRKHLKERFFRFYGFEPPSRFSRKLMLLAVAYRMQEKVYGGLKPATRRFLLKAPDSTAKPQKASRIPIRLKTGTVLVREWRGVTHQVTVLEQGFLFGGKPYRSLSEIARAITGAHWSGPTFFGLKKLAGTADHER